LVRTSLSSGSSTVKMCYLYT